MQVVSIDDVTTDAGEKADQERFVMGAGEFLAWCELDGEVDGVEGCDGEDEGIGFVCKQAVGVGQHR